MVVKNRKPLTLKQIVDRVDKGIRKQGCKATTKEGICQYRTKRGKKVLRCGIGQLIPKRLYDPAMESKTISSVIGNLRQIDEIQPDAVDLWVQGNKKLYLALVAVGVDVRDALLGAVCLDLQSIHDHTLPKVGGIRGWAAGIKEIKVAHGIK